MPYRVEIGYLPEGILLYFPSIFFFRSPPIWVGKAGRLAIGWACLPQRQGWSRSFREILDPHCSDPRDGAWEREDVQMHEGFPPGRKGKALGGGRLREARRDAEA